MTDSPSLAVQLLRDMRSRLQRWLPWRQGAQSLPSPESCDCLTMPSSCGEAVGIDLSKILDASFDPPPLSAVDELLDMKTSTHGQAKAQRRLEDGRPKHKIRLWSLEELKRYGPSVPPAVFYLDD